MRTDVGQMRMRNLFIYFCFCLLSEVLRYLAKWLLESFTHSTNILGNDSAQAALHSHKLPQDWNVGFLKINSLEMRLCLYLSCYEKNIWILVSWIYSLEMNFLSPSSQLRTNNAGREQRDGNISPPMDWLAAGNMCLKFADRKISFPLNHPQSPTHPQL